MVSEAKRASAIPMLVTSSMESSRSARTPDALSPHGSPARFSFSWSASVLPAPALRFSRCPTLSRKGRTTRSKSGSDISTSARVAGARPASANCARRASSRSPCRGDTDMAIPKVMSMMPPAAAMARPIASRLISDLDLHDLLDRDSADGDREDRHPEHDVPEWVGDHGIEVGGGDERKESRKRNRQDRDDPPGCTSLRGQGADLSLDTHTLADGERDGVENLGEVAADHALNLDCGHHEVEVLGLVARDHVVERLVDVDTQRYLARGPGELFGDRRVGVLGDRRERLREGVSSFQRVAEQHQSVAELIVEGACPALLPELEEEAAEDVDEDGARDERDRPPEAECDQRADTDAEAHHHQQPLGRLQLEVGLLQIIGELAGVGRP